MDSSEINRSSAGVPTTVSCCLPSQGMDLPKKNPLAKNREQSKFDCNLATIPAGEFKMGSDVSTYPSDGEGPQRSVWVDQFQISQFTVSNKEFNSFIAATGYKTDAEKFGWSYVFKYFLSETQLTSNVVSEIVGAPWWIPINGANWRNPFGDNRDFEEYLEHPVVHVSQLDAQAFCSWSGTRLPSEAEWEKASRGGLDGEDYPWGNSLITGNKHSTNIWQGDFPTFNSKEDGYFGTAPVTAFAPNSYGLFNTVGNVWEWTGDYWSAKWHYRESTETRVNPRGPSNTNGNYVLKGGSYLCHASYCARYRNSARTYNSPNSSSGHIGFRYAK